MKIFKIKQRAMATTLALILAAGLLMYQQGAFAVPTFADVPTSHWAYSYIAKASELGFVSGVGNNRFQPDGQVTFAQMGTMMVRALYTGEEQNYSGSSWWMPYVKAADAHDLWVSTSMADQSDWATFADQPVTRAQMAQILYNAFRATGAEMPTAAETASAKAAIRDYAKIPSIYRTAVVNCYALNLLAGTDGGNFAPNNNMTRAQAAVVLCRAYGLVSGDVTGSGTVTTPPEPPKPVDARPEGAVGGKYDINCYTVPADVNKDGYITEAEVQAVIEQLQIEYPAGTIWGADGVGRYVSKAMGSGKGCAGWAYLVSDRIFGDLPRRQIENVENLRIGDLKYSNIPHWTVYLGDEVIDGVLYDDGCSTTSASAANPISWYISGGLYQDIAEMMTEGRVKLYTRYPAE